MKAAQIWDACAKQDFLSVKRGVSEMQVRRRQRRWWFTRNPQGVVMSYSTHFVYSYNTLG